MDAKTITIAVEGATTIAIDSLVPFQGELKSLAREEYEKLRKNILENDYSFTVHIWKNKDKNYIIDGHQRVWTLKQMRDVEGYKIPKLPVSIVKAKSFKAAKKKVLAGISTYGKMSKDSLYDFLQENDIEFDDVVSEMSFGSVDLSDLAEMFENPTKEDELPEPGSETTPDLRSASDSVKQVNLFFTENDYTEFVEKTADLCKNLKTQNISDTVLGAIREAHKARKKAK